MTQQRPDPEAKALIDFWADVGVLDAEEVEALYAAAPGVPDASTARPPAAARAPLAPRTDPSTRQA